MTTASGSSVVVRRVRRDDEEALLAGNRRSRAALSPWVSPFLTETAFDAWFENQSQEDAASFLVLERRSGDIAGVFNLSRIVLGNFRSAYLGYWGLQGFGGRGLMTLGLRLVAQEAFGRMGLHRLEANIQPGNTRSIAMVERVGFRLEGFSPRYLRIDGDWRDHQRWALLAD